MTVLNVGVQGGRDPIVHRGLGARAHHRHHARRLRARRGQRSDPQWRAGRPRSLAHRLAQQSIAVGGLRPGDEIMSS
jgi:hypothetical protein